MDFDGTLVEPNVAILLVERFCPDGQTVAHEVDLQLHSGKITLREAWDRQAALLPGDRIDEMRLWAVDNVPLREGAKEFLALLARHDLPRGVVSGGLDFYIRAVLDREGLDVPFVSDSLRKRPDGRVEVIHPFGHATCRLCGICKAQVVRSPVPAAERTVFVGDGSTDRYGAEVADIIFARHRLRTYCERSGIPFIPFDGFPTVTAQFERWLSGSEPIPVRPHLGLETSSCPISLSLAGVAPGDRATRPRVEPDRGPFKPSSLSPPSGSPQGFPHDGGRGP
ncbi:MAG: HAD-IB family phosphatase [Thermoplasmata archaeon]